MLLFVGTHNTGAFTQNKSDTMCVAVWCNCVVATVREQRATVYCSGYLVAGTMAPAARALRAGLKEAAGKLMAQLYDRNSRRQFLPAEAFQTDSLPPERFRVEMQTAAAASGGLMQATNTRVWGLLRHGHSPPPCCLHCCIHCCTVTVYSCLILKNLFGVSSRNFFWAAASLIVVRDS